MNAYIQSYTHKLSTWLYSAKVATNSRSYVIFCKSACLPEQSHQLCAPVAETVKVLKGGACEGAPGPYYKVEAEEPEGGREEPKSFVWGLPCRTNIQNLKLGRPANPPMSGVICDRPKDCPLWGVIGLYPPSQNN